MQKESLFFRKENGKEARYLPEAFFSQRQENERNKIFSLLHLISNDGWAETSIE